MNRRSFFASIPFVAALPKMLGAEKKAQWPPDPEKMTAKHIAPSVRGISDEYGNIESVHCIVSGDHPEIKAGDTVFLDASYGAQAYVSPSGDFLVHRKEIILEDGGMWTEFSFVRIRP